MTEAQVLELQARHETGHAVVAEDLGFTVQQIVLRPNREIVRGIRSTITGWTGITHPKPKVETIGFFIALAVAGYMAIYRTGNVDGLRSEIRNFGLDWLHLEEELRELQVEPGIHLGAMCEGVITAEVTLAKHAEAIEKIIAVLVRDRRISGDEIRTIMREAN